MLVKKNGFKFAAFYIQDTELVIVHIDCVRESSHLLLPRYGKLDSSLIRSATCEIIRGLLSIAVSFSNDN